MTWLLRKRLRQHQEFFEEYEYPYPNVLLVAGNASTERRLFKQVECAIQDFEFYITEEELLLSGNKKIWVYLMESDEVDFARVSLGQ